MFIIIILVFFIIAWAEMVPLYKNKKKKELTVYSVFFCTAFILSMLISFGVEIPSVAKGIKVIVEAIIGKKGH